MAEDEETSCLNSMQLFRMAVSKNLENIAECVSEDEFREIFTFLKSDPKKADMLHKIMVKELHSAMTKDFEEILNEGDLKDALTKINRLSEESVISSKKDAWRPSGDVTSHMRSLDANTMKKAIAELQKEVNEMERRNESLRQKVVEGRSRICVLNDSLKRHLNNAPIVLERLEKTYAQLMAGLEVIEGE